MIKFNVCLMALAMSQPIHAQNQKSARCLGITQVLALAAVNAPAVQISQARESEQEAEVKSSRSLFQPQVSAFSRLGSGDSSLINSSITSQVGLRLSQRVLDFGDAKFSRIAARENYMASLSETQSVRNNAAIESGYAFLQRLEAIEELELTRERRKYFSQQLDLLDTLLADGQATRFERAEIAARLAETESYELELQFKKRQAELLLKVRAGYFSDFCSDETEAELLQNKLKPLNIGIAVNKALEINPEIKALKYRSKGLEAEQERIERGRFPVIDIIGIGAYSKSSPFQDASFRDYIGFDVSVPIFSGGSLTAQKQSAAARKAIAVGQVFEAQRDLRERIFVLNGLSKSLKNQLNHLREAEKQTFLQFELAEKERKAGNRTFLDVIEIRLRYEGAGLQSVHTKYELERQALELMFLTGEISF